MVADHLVERLRLDAGHDVRDEHVEHLGGEPPGAAHAFERGLVEQLDGAGAAHRGIGGDGHIIGHGRRYSGNRGALRGRSEEHTSELQSLMRISYAVFCLKKKKTNLTVRAIQHTATKTK